MKKILYTIGWILLAMNAEAETGNGLFRPIKEFIAKRQARTGVAILIDGKEVVTVNNDEKYPLMSVFKLHQALAVADSLQRAKLPLSTCIHITRQELRPDTYSPLREAYPHGDIYLPISELLRYTLQLSDNNACDILFAHFGGPAATDRYIRSLGIQEFSIVADENDMHRKLSLCYNNWSTPLAAARTIELLFTRQLFANEYQSFIKQTLLDCQTGTDRLPRPWTGSNVRIAHKTGTGDRNANGAIIGTNDVGCILLPDGRHITIAVLVKDSMESPEETAQLIADISGVLAKAFGFNSCRKQTKR